MSPDLRAAIESDRPFLIRLEDACMPAYAALAFYVREGLRIFERTPERIFVTTEAVTDIARA